MVLTEEQLQKFDDEIKQRGMGINPANTFQDEADSYSYTPEATMPEQELPQQYAAPAEQTTEDDLYTSDAYITGPTKINPNPAALKVVEFTDRVADNIKKTNIYKRATYTKDDVLREAKEINIETGIPVSSILYNAETLDNARNIYNYRRKQMELMMPGENEVSVNGLMEAYPGLDKIINSGNEVDAAIALQNIKNVRQMTGIVEIAKGNWNIGLLERKMGQTGVKAFREGRAVSEEEFAKYDAIQKQIQEFKETPGFFEDPMMSIVGGTARQIPQQLTGVGTGTLYGGVLAGLAAGATVLASPATGGASLAAVPAAAKTGFSWGMRAGYAVDMFENSAGQRYIEYSRFKDDNGKRVLTDEEARAYAAVAAAVETGIEFMNAGKILDVLQGNKSAAAKQIREVVAGATDNATFVAGLKRMLSGAAEVAVSESVEEGAQEGADRLISTGVSLYKGTTAIPRYTPGQMLEGALENTLEALPASIGFGLSAAGGGSIGLVQRAARLAEIGNFRYNEEMKNVTGVGMVKTMSENTEVKEFFKKDPDVAKQVLKNTVAGTGYEKVNIDTEMVARQENGLAALRDIGERAGMSVEEIQTAIETGADLTVPTEVYFQMRAENENFAINDDFIAFSDVAPSYARNKYYAEMKKAEIDAIMNDANTRQLEQQMAAIDRIVQDNFAEGIERDAAAAVLTMRPDNPIEGLKEMRGMYKEQLDSLLAPVIRKLEKGMKQGVDIVRVEGDRDARYERVSNNAEWAREFYKENKRWPTKFELEGMAIDILSGRDFSKLADYQNVPEMQEYYEANAAQIDELLGNIEAFDNIEERIANIDADELQTMEGMSREAYDIYKRESANAIANAPNDAVKRAAKMGAALLAYRADRYAEAKRAAGETNYTAKDYYDRTLQIKYGGTFQQPQKEQYFQVSAEEFNRQKDAVRKQYENTDQWMKAPNGEDTNLTEDQWVTVRTDAFKNWFGDWENDPQNASKIVDENGEPLPVYHGTKKYFKTFDTRRVDLGAEYGNAAYFTSDMDEAFKFGNNVMMCYLNIRNPKVGTQIGRDIISMRGFDSNGKDGGIINFVGVDTNNTYLKFMYKNAPDAPAKEILSRILSARTGTAREDETIKEYVDRIGKTNDIAVTWYLVPEATQIKDASGQNVGFDPQSGNIYLQEAGPERDLVAYHNMSEDSLLKSAALGGLPVPSIAVTKKDTPFNQFGQITLIGGSDIVDPSRSGNDVYSQDAWTVTFPETVYDKVKVKDIREFADDVKDAFNDLGGDSRTQLSEFVYKLQNDHRRRYMQTDLYNSLAMKYKYVKDVLGETVKIPTKKVQVNEEYILKNKKIREAILDFGPQPSEEQKKKLAKLLLPVLKEYAKTIPTQKSNTITINGETYTDRGPSFDGRQIVNSKGEKQSKEIVYAITNLLHYNDVEKTLEHLREVAQKTTPVFPKLAQKAIEFIENAKIETDDLQNQFVSAFFDKDGSVNERIYYNLLLNARLYGKTEVDDGKLRKSLEKKIAKNEKGYNDYINQQLDRLYRNPKIMIGNKKADITLDNIVEAMMKKRGAGKEDSIVFNNHKALASMAKKFKSLDEIRKNKNRLTDSEKAELSYKVYEEAGDNYREVVGPYYKYGITFDTYDDANKAVVDAAKAGGSESAIRNALRRNNFKDIPDNVVEAMKAVLEAAKDVQTDYFEAKPLRAVGFNEFSAAVVPKGTSKEAVDFLKSQGVAVTKYDPEIPGDRQAKTQKAAEKANVYFQRQQAINDTIQGATEFRDNGQRVVTVFDSGNESTIAHELGHVFVADLKDLAEMPNAPEQIKKDWQTIKEWLGYKDSQTKFTTAQQEKFARGFEAYLRTGEAPSTGLRKVFQNFKNWLCKIYRDFLSLGGKPSKDVQAVMGRMLATADEVEQAFKLREAESFEKAGGFDYLAKDSLEMYKRWQKDAQEYAKEKVLKEAMKNLTEQRAKELEAVREKMTEDIRTQLLSTPVYRAELVLSANPKLANDWPAEQFGMTYEEYTEAIETQGTLEEATKKAVDVAMQEVEEGLPLEEIKRDAENVVNTSEYRGMYLAFEQEFIDKKKIRDEAVNKQIEKALADIEKAASGIGKERREESKMVQNLRQKIRELKYQARWTAAEADLIRKIELAAKDAEIAETKQRGREQANELREERDARVAEARQEGRERLAELREEKNAKIEEVQQKSRDKLANLAETKNQKIDELRKAVNDFRSLFNQTRNRVRVYRDTSVNKYKLIKQYAQDNMAEMNVDDATNVAKWTALEKRAGRESVEALKKALDAELRYKPEEAGLVATEPASEERLPGESRNAETVDELWQKAAEAKLRQRVFAEYAAIATKNKAKVQRKNARLQARQKTIERNNNIPANERYMYVHGLYVLGLSKTDAQMPQGEPNIVAMFKEYQDNLQAFFVDEDGKVNLPDYILSAFSGNAVYNDGYTNLTMDQYDDFVDVLTAIYKAGIDANKVKSMKDANGNTVLISDVCESVIAEMNARVPAIVKDDITNAGSMTFKEAIQDKARRARVSLTKPETILEWMGPTAHRYIYETVNQSWNKEKVMQEQVAVAVKAIWAPYTNTEKSEMRSKRQFRFGTSILTREEMICVAFNWGTELNRKRIMDGFNVDESTVRELLSNMTQKDWQMVTSVWDLVNSYWPETVKVEESMVGVAPEKQSAMPFEIVGKDGNVYKLNGGYYPIIYDPNKSLAAANQAQEDVAKQMAGGNAAMNRNRGHLKQRTKQKVTRPVMLSFNVLNKHLSNVVHNICFRESLRDVNRIIKNQAVSTAIEDHFGIPQARAFRKWVEDCWAPDVQNKDFASSALEFFRHKQTAAALGYRATTALLNSLNIFPITHYLGPARTIDALQKFYNSPKENWNFAMDRSVFLRERAETMDRDAGEVLRKEFIGGYGVVADTLIRGERAIEAHAFDMLAVTDLALACPLWLSEYQRVYEQSNKNLAELDEDAITRLEMEAVAAGDKAVRKIFGSGEMKDLAPIQKGGEMTKAVTMFYSYFNVVFNALYGGYAQGRREAMTEGATKVLGQSLGFRIAPLVKAFLYWTVLTGVFEGLQRNAIDVLVGGSDDPEEWLKKMFKGVSDNVFGTIPIVRDGASYIVDRLMGERYYGAKPLPVYQLLDTGMKLLNTIESKKKTKIDVFREGMRITNGFTGIGNTLTDAMATTAYWVDTDFDKPFLEYLSAVIFDKRIDKKKKKK